MPPKTKAQAIKEVDRQMISPADCFVEYVSSAAGWEPMTRGGGTGCAHYVAHKLSIKRGRKQDLAVCDLGFTVKVHGLIEGMVMIVDPAKVAVNDVWVNQEKSHCGVVVKVEPAAPSAKTKLPKITISQCSSNRKVGRLGVNEQDWGTFFHGAGKFYRPASGQK